MRSLLHSTPRAVSGSAVLLLAVALTAGACSGSGGDLGLADTVRAQGEAQEALRGRVGDIEDQIEAVLSRDEITDFRTVQETLEALQTRLDEVASEVDTLSTQAEDRSATVDAAMTELADEVAALTAAIGALDAELQQLREDHESLLRQFTTHRSDDSRHR